MVVSRAGFAASTGSKCAREHEGQRGLFWGNLSHVRQPAVCYGRCNHGRRGLGAGPCRIQVGGCHALCKLNLLCTHTHTHTHFKANKQLTHKQSLRHLPAVIRVSAHRQQLQEKKTPNKLKHTHALRPPVIMQVAAHRQQLLPSSWQSCSTSTFEHRWTRP